MIAHVHTDEGLSGLGYSLAFGGGGAESIQVYLETRLAPLLVGEDPRLVERLWERMYRADRGIRRLGVAAYALRASTSRCGTSSARWPVSRSIGSGAGSRTASRPTGAAAGRRYRVEDMVEEAQRYAALGLRYYKLKVHHPDPRENRRRAEAVQNGARRRRPAHGRRQPEARRAGEPAPGRRARGPGPRLVRGAGARRTTSPRAPRSPRAIRIPVATGENHYTRFEFRELLRAARARATSCPTSAGRTASARRSRSGTWRRPTSSSSRPTSSTSCRSTSRARSRTASSSSTWTGCRPICFVDVPRRDPADGLVRIPDRPGHGMALAPGAEQKYRLR